MSGPPLSSAPTRDEGEPTPARARPAKPRPPEGTDQPLESGSALGRYVVLYRIGGGGMGVVYAAYDPELDRKIALKVLRPRSSAARRARGHRRLLKEAQALARLAHPNVVAIHDVGSIDDVVYVAMDFVEGQTLREWLRGRTRTLDEIVDVFLQAGRGLAAAHEAGIVHRDFKPDNVIVQKVGPDRSPSGRRVQVLDFGLAQVRETQESEPSGHSGRRTRPDEHPEPAVGRVGTPGYMAPEQHLGLLASVHADQFSFCICLYEALCRRTPFSGPTTQELMENTVEGKVREFPRNSQVPGHLRKLVLRGLSREPQDRFPSMKDLLTELARRPWRRRRRIATTAVVALSLSAGTWLWARSHPSGEVRCQSAQTRLEPVWSEQARDRVRQGLQATSRTHAELTAQRVIEALDRYAASWTEAHTEACEATHVHHEQSEEVLDLRMACLGQGRNELQALVEVLSEADDDVADHALTAALSLPAISPCADVVRLRDRSALPDDPQVREAIEQQRSRLAHARALDHAGRIQDAVAVSRGVVEQARQLHHPPLLAAALLEHARALETLGQATQAASLLTEAALVAEASRDDRLVLDARINLITVVGDRLTKIDEGKLWAQMARATLERLGGDPAVEAQIENSVSFVIASEVPPEVVLEHQRRALDLATKAEVPDHERASYASNLAATLAEVGRHEEALKMAEQARTLLEQSLGPTHYRTAILDATVGLIYDYRSDYDEALQHYEQALQNLDRALGPGNLKSASILNNVAITAAKSGDLDRAVEAFSRVLELHRREQGEQSADVAQAYHNLGAAEGMRARHEQALSYHQKALSIRQEVFGPQSQPVAGSLDGIANELERLGRPRESLQYRRKAFAIHESVYGPQHFEMTVPLANLAHSLIENDELKEARQMAERGLQLALEHDQPTDIRAFCRLVLAKALSGSGHDLPRAKALLEQAREELGDLAAPAERRLIAELEERHGWGAGP